MALPMATSTAGDEPHLHFDDLSREVDFVRKAFHFTTAEDAFVAWFQAAAVTGDLDLAAQTLVGQSGDRGIDAIHIDRELKIVFFTQCKFHKAFGRRHEPEETVSRLVDSGRSVRSTDGAFREWRVDFPPTTMELLTQARSALVRDGYTLQLYFATTGAAAADMSRRLTKVARDAGSELKVFASPAIRSLLRSYLDGIMPPIDEVDLPIVGSGLRRTDSTTPFQAEVCTVNGADLGKVVRAYAPRIFARNVRGFLGHKGVINKRIGDSIRKHPERFWFLNNGGTIICRDYSLQGNDGAISLNLKEPQIVNGQQTAVVLEDAGRSARKAELIVRVIAVGRSPQEERERLISELVLASNSQNSVAASDLVSNDFYQTSLERQFLALGFAYLRKKGFKYKSRQAWGPRMKPVKKEELAQAVASTLGTHDPSIVRAGKEGLFVEPLYSEIFGSRRPQDFLNRYYLMQHVKRSASGIPKRSYAKWHVLNLCWREMHDVIEAAPQSFRTASRNWRSHDDVNVPLARAIDQVYRSSLDFYKSVAGTGVRALDVSNFFYQKGQKGGQGGRQRHLIAYWEGPGRKRRDTVNRLMMRVEEGLHALSDEY